MSVGQADVDFEFDFPYYWKLVAFHISLKSIWSSLTDTVLLSFFQLELFGICIELNV